MKWKAHIAIAIALASSITKNPVYLISAGFFGILPDMDFWFHRSGLSHSITTVIVAVTNIILVTYLFYELDFLLAMMAFVGIGTHICLDMMTVSGVPLLWPWKKNLVRIPPHVRYDNPLMNHTLVIISIGLLFIILRQ